MSSARAKYNSLPETLAKLPAELVLRDSEPGACAFYTWQNIVIACWSTQATGPTLQRFARVREAMDREYVKGGSVLFLIADGAGLPTQEARLAAKQLMERYRDRRAALGIVIFGQGFWVSAMRGAIISVLALSTRKMPLKIFHHVEEVVDWLPEQHESRTGVHVGREELLAILRELAAQL